MTQVRCRTIAIQRPRMLLMPAELLLQVREIVQLALL